MSAVPSEFVNQAMPQRQGGAQPGQARHPRLPRARRRHCATPTSTWRTRSSAATRPTRWRCAAPSRWRIDIEREIRLVRRGQAIPAQSPLRAAHQRLRPGLQAATMSDYDPARAKALLDLYGYVDRDGDGWREQPDGRPLVLRDRHPARPLLAPVRRAVEEEHGRARPAHPLRPRPVGRAAEAAPSRQADDVDRWAASAARPDGRTCSVNCTARRPADRTWRASSWPRSTACTNAWARSPTVPSARHCSTGPSAWPWPTCPTATMCTAIVNDLVQPWLIGYRRPVFWLDWWQHGGHRPGASS